jgi:hypothetical protein
MRLGIPQPTEWQRIGDEIGVTWDSFTLDARAAKME